MCNPRRALCTCSSSSPSTSAYSFVRLPTSYRVRSRQPAPRRNPRIAAELLVGDQRVILAVEGGGSRRARSHRGGERGPASRPARTRDGGTGSADGMPTRGARSAPSHGRGGPTASWSPSPHHAIGGASPPHRRDDGSADRAPETSGATPVMAAFRTVQPRQRRRAFSSSVEGPPRSVGATHAPDGISGDHSFSARRPPFPAMWCSPRIALVTTRRHALAKSWITDRGGERDVAKRTVPLRSAFAASRGDVVRQAATTATAPAAGDRLACALLGHAASFSMPPPAAEDRPTGEDCKWL
mgnify:CR=1 FL=1